MTFTRPLTLADHFRLYDESDDNVTGLLAEAHDPYLSRGADSVRRLYNDLQQHLIHGEQLIEKLAYEVTAPKTIGVIKEELYRAAGIIQQQMAKDADLQRALENKYNYLPRPKPTLSAS